jgi:glycosyltransferase involved in cell wall biosynthesis
VKEFQPDVIHAPWINPEGVAASLLGLEHGIPCVVQGIGNDANFYLQKYPGRGYVVDKIEKAAALLFNCQSVRQMAEGAGLRNAKTVVIYHGVDVDQFQPDPNRTEFGRKIITVAQLIPRKNHQLLLQAFAKLPLEIRDTSTLEFVGGGPCRLELEEQARELGIGDRVNFAGQPSHEELVRHLQEADLFCLPTLSEGMPVAVIEAMACGLPVVASKVDGIPESVREDITGLLVPPQDVDALRNALLRALTRDWDRQAIRQEVLAKFTWRLYAEKVAELYRGLLNGA